MGKLRALKLGITKGIQHTIDPKHRAVNKLLSKLHCLDCGHGSFSHTRRLPQFQNLSKTDFRVMVLSTGFPGYGGWHECRFLHCDKCDHKSTDKNLKDCQI